MSALLLGIDIGTTACKAAVVDAAGAELAHGQAPTPWRRVPTGAELDPGALLDAVVTAADEALARAAATRVAAVGVASMAEAGVLLDDAGVLLHPVISWRDSRGVAEAQAIGRELPQFSATTGLPVSPLCSLAKLRHLHDAAPRTRAGRSWHAIAEWVVRRLGGRDVSELSLASRTGLLDVGRAVPWDEAHDWASLPRDLLGELAVAGSPAGRGDGVALPASRDAVLTVAGHDHLVAGVGVGVVAPGDVLDSCGTAEALVRVVAPPLDRESTRRGVTGGVGVSRHVVAGQQALLGSVWSGLALGEVLDALGQAGADREALGARALALDLRDVPALDLDLHALERRPPALPDGDPAAIWRAAVDRVAREVAAVLDHIDAVAGPHSRVVVTGGWARDSVVLAAKRALGAIAAPPVAEAGCRGAALLAGVAAGLFAGVHDLPSVPVPAKEPA